MGAPFATAYVRRKRWATRISCHAASPTSACAAFIKESRMKFANAIKVYRKSGGSPSKAFTQLQFVRLLLDNRVVAVRK
ncbi:MAG: hypothetical protein QOJ51_6568 [Acidobacteriaceae bacterium]|jgi:hypothetical protein|nr:hypothetical protein [Acidobacteriaceae bacterium]MEA2263743.1 hypothetical protein [Acidobacteriaceae bacterium]